MPTITLKIKNKSLGDYKLQNGFSLTIGRRENNDVIIDDPAVSGHHTKIDSLGDRYVKNKSDVYYLDYIGGLPRPKVKDKTVTKSTILHDLDIIDIGAVKLQFSNKETT